MPDHLRNPGKPKNEDSNLDINRIVFPNLDQVFILELLVFNVVQIKNQQIKIDNFVIFEKLASLIFK